MNKWVWAGAGSVAAFALGFVLYQSLFGNNDEALEVKKPVPPVVQKAKVNKKKYELNQFMNNNGGPRNSFTNGLFGLPLESPKAGESISNVPLKLFKDGKIMPVVGQKLWVTFTPDLATGVHKAVAISDTPPVEVKAGNIVLMGEYKALTLQPADKKKNLNIIYGEFDESKQAMKDVLLYKSQDDPQVTLDDCVNNNKLTDVCILKRFNRIEFIFEIDEYGQTKMKTIKPAEGAIEWKEYFGRSIKTENKETAAEEKTE